MVNEKDIDRCDCNVIHLETVDKVKQMMPQDETLMDLGDFFRIFGDTTRIKIIYALLCAEMCVCDIASLIGMTKSAVSHQLRILKQDKIVRYRKDGKVVYYSLTDDHVRNIVSQGLSHISED